MQDSSCAPSLLSLQIPQTGEREWLRVLPANDRWLLSVHRKLSLVPAVGAKNGARPQIFKKDGEVVDSSVLGDIARRYPTGLGSCEPTLMQASSYGPTNAVARWKCVLTCPPSSGIP
jgi:hypothetical protein